MDSREPPGDQNPVDLGLHGEVARHGETQAADIEMLHKPYATADLARAIRETLNP